MVKWKMNRLGRFVGIGLVAVSALLLVVSTARAQAATADAMKESEPALVVVAGASGKTGRLVLEHAARSGFRVRALTRNPMRARDEVADTYDWVAADVREPATLSAALSGASYVVCTIGATERSGPNSPEFVDYGGVKNLTEAAVEAGVRQFVLVSSVGAGGGGGVFGWLLNTVLMPGVLDWKARGEQHLRGSGLPYTILRPGGLTDDAGGRSGIRVAEKQTLGGGTIPRADVAAVAVHVLGRNEAVGKTLELASDEESAVDAWQAAIERLSRDEPQKTTSR